MILHGMDFGTEALSQFCSRWQIDELAVFGSVLRDDFRPDSDIDLLVTFAESAPWDLLDLIRMQDEAASILGRPVDLVSRRGIQESANRIVKQDVLGTAESIYAKGMERADFLSNPMAKAAVVLEIEIMGEAAGRVPDEVRSAHGQVPWSELARLRNFYIHVYHGVDYTLVWRTATVTVPRVASAVRIFLPPPPEGGPQ